MSRRLRLHAILQAVIGIRVDGKANVYFQPPPAVSLNYPCIVYSRSTANTFHANDLPYLSRFRYQVTLIDKDPDSPINEKILALPLCSYDRGYAASNLNHDVYNIYY